MTNPALANPQVEPPAERVLRSHMPELDTIRGIAVLLVLFFHGFGSRYGLQGLSGPARLIVAATLPGRFGVNLFFVLSGFLITGILLDTKPRHDYYRRFYMRRALRILPLYYAVLLLLLVMARTGLVGRHVTWAFLGLSFVYLANVTQLFGVPMQYGVLWSLAVEEHFYLLWPTVVRWFSRHRVTVVASLVCIVCPGLRAFYFLRGYDLGTGYTWLVADGLAMGAVLAGIARGPWGTRRQMWRITGVALASSLAMFAVGARLGIFLASRLAGSALRETALNLLFAGTVALALLAGTSRWKTLVNRPLLQFFGAISYCAYLIHLLMFELTDHMLQKTFPALPSGTGNFGVMVFRFSLGAGLTVAVAYFSRRYFEDPLLRLKRYFGDQLPEPTILLPEGTGAHPVGPENDLQTA